MAVQNLRLKNANDNPDKSNRFERIRASYCNLMFV